jgi:hypothetical protein
MGSGAQALGLGFGGQGNLDAYWATSGRINRFDVRSFCRQVATFCQLTGFLMTANLDEVMAPKIAGRGGPPAAAPAGGAGAAGRGGGRGGPAGPAGGRGGGGGRGGAPAAGPPGRGG